MSKQAVITNCDAKSVIQVRNDENSQEKKHVLLVGFKPGKLLGRKNPKSLGGPVV
jgi:hypothetical protein